VGGQACNVLIVLKVLLPELGIDEGKVVGMQVQVSTKPLLPYKGRHKQTHFLGNLVPLISA
jgi:hypothetical protein